MTLSLFLNPQIRAYAKANGLVFTADEIERINTDVSGIATTDENNGLRFNLAGGSVQTVKQRGMLTPDRRPKLTPWMDVS